MESKKKKRTMSEAQKAAMAAGRAAGRALRASRQAAENVLTVAAKPSPQPWKPKAQEEAKAPQQSASPPKRMISASTVLFPESFFQTAEPTEPTEATPPTDASVRAEQERYASEDWKLMWDGKVEFSGTADACYQKALLSRKASPGSEMFIVDPSGTRLQPSEEDPASRLARQARNWAVERQNGGACTVLFRGSMQAAEKAFEQEAQRCRGSTIVLLDGTGHPVDQVSKPQFRTTVNGPDKDIQVDSTSYKAFVDQDDAPVRIEVVSSPKPSPDQHVEPQSIPQPPHPSSAGISVENPKLVSIFDASPLSIQLERVSIAMAYVAVLQSHLRDEQMLLKERLVEEMGRLSKGQSPRYAQDIDQIITILRGLR